MRRLTVVVMILSLLASTPSIQAQDDECIELSPLMRASIESGSEYYDVWLQGPRAHVTYKFGFEGWIIASDYGGGEGSDYENNTDIGYWFVTSLDPNFAEIYKIEEGHSDYLSSYPNSKDFGYDFKLLSEDLHAPLECGEEAAKTTGGLGIDRETWSDRFGETNETDEGFQTQDGEYQFSTTDGRVHKIVWTPAIQLSPLEARPLTRDLIPDDARLAGVSADSPPSNVAQPDTYQSGWLSERFDDEGVWGDSDLGSFATTYEMDPGGMVTRVTIQTGWDVPAESTSNNSDSVIADTPGVAPASYTVYVEEQIDPPNQRTRWVLRITMDPYSGTEPLIEGIAQAVRDGLAAHPDAVCIVVFANSFDTDSGMDIGRGFVSVDGLGLDGQGGGLIGSDTGEIQIELLGLDGIIYKPV